MKTRWTKRILFFLILIFGILISIQYGHTVLASYVDDTDFNEYLKKEGLKVAYIPYPFDSTHDVFPEPGTISNIGDLESISPIVVKVRLKKNATREIYYDCVLSQIEVVNVYKGNVTMGEILDLFEPMSCELKDHVVASDGYNVMQEGEEYIVFLKTLYGAYYTKNEHTYVPTTPAFSKYQCTKAPIGYFQEEDLYPNKVLYNDVRNQEILLCDKESYNIYVYIKRQVMEKYNN